MLNLSYIYYYIQENQNFPFSVINPPLISNGVSLPTTELCSSSTLTKINDNQKTYTPFSSTFIITTTSQSIIPIKTQSTTFTHPFMINNNYNQQMDTAPLLTFDPVVNSNLKMNKIVSPLDKGK